MRLAKTNFPDAQPLRGGNPVSRKWTSIGLAILIVAVAGGLAWELFCAARPPDPLYQGKPLSAWLDRAVRNTGFFDPAPQEAVRHAGANAIPYLLWAAKPRAFELKKKILSVLPRKFGDNFQLIASRDQFKAWYGFQALSPAAKPAIPALITPLSDEDAGVRAHAARYLGFIGPEAHDAIPILIRRLNDENQQVRAASEGALDSIPPTTVDEIPALLHLLKATQKEATITTRLLDRIATFGGQAKEAAPVVQLYLDESDPAIHASAAKALKQIDAEAAAKAGIH